jgi:hypothetical protein
MGTVLFVPAGPRLRLRVGGQRGGERHPGVCRGKGRLASVDKRNRPHCHNWQK